LSPCECSRGSDAMLGVLSPCECSRGLDVMLGVLSPCECSRGSDAMLGVLSPWFRCHAGGIVPMVQMPCWGCCPHASVHVVSVVLELCY
jgi:hypothetical protein